MLIRFMLSHSVITRRFGGVKKNRLKCGFFFVPEGIYRLDMTKKEVTTLKSPENEPKS